MTLMPRALSATLLSLSAALASAVTLPGPVVDASWLAQHLDEVQVVDVRSNVKTFTAPPEFDTDAKSGKKTLREVGGHIAGSRLIDMKTMRTDRQIGDLKVKYMIPERAEFEKTVRAAGLGQDKPIVLVPVGSDLADVDDALRVYWQLKVYGEDKIAVLDGGMANWLVEGRAHSTEAITPQAGTWTSSADRSRQYFADTQDVAKAIAGHSATLVDARDAKQFNGLTKRDYVGAYGHLDGAKLYPTDLMFKSAGGAVKFMSPATYRGLLSAQGIDPQAPAITYCNSGHLSSGPWFLMSELLGNRETRLYDGSLHQWTLEQRSLAGAVPLN
jgi:thiosulfate/3-mercaptopyruvate sulfurtransferase